MTDTLYLFALEREAKPFRRRCPTAVVEVIGVGPIAATSGAKKAIASHRPKSVVLAGFAGGELVPSLKLGDIVVANDIVEAGQHPLAGRASDGKTLSRRLLSTPSIVATPEEKRRLAQQYDADAADMESAAVARVCADAGLPLVCIRVISDTVDTSLSPQLVDLVSGGRVSLIKAFLAIVRQPRLLPEMLQLARDTRFAAQRLAEALTAGISHAAP